MDQGLIDDIFIKSISDIEEHKDGKGIPFFSMFQPILQPTESLFAYDQMVKGLPENPRIAWYPSAGSDFSDILFFGHVAPSCLGMLKAPDIYIHTDYAFNGYTFKPSDDDPIKDFPGHFYGSMEVQVLQTCHLGPSRGFATHYHVDERLATFPEQASSEGQIVLYDIAYKTKGECRTYRGRTLVLYAHWENLNFMSNFLAATSSKVNYLYHQIDGCGFGGGRVPMNDALFPFLRPLGVEAVFSYRPEFREREPWLETVAAETGWQPELYELDPVFDSTWLVRECSEPWSPDVLSKIWEDATRKIK